MEDRDLSKEFGKLTAVDDVSFNIEEGLVFVFLRLNGTGETTAINMLCTLLIPSSGGVVLQQTGVDSPFLF